MPNTTFQILDSLEKYSLKIMPSMEMVAAFTQFVQDIYRPDLRKNDGVDADGQPADVPTFIREDTIPRFILLHAETAALLTRDVIVYLFATSRGRDILIADRSGGYIPLHVIIKNGFNLATEEELGSQANCLADLEPGGLEALAVCYETNTRQIVNTISLVYKNKINLLSLLENYHKESAPLDTLLDEIGCTFKQLMRFNDFDEDVSLPNIDHYSADAQLRMSDLYEDEKEALFIPDAFLSSVRVRLTESGFVSKFLEKLIAYESLYEHNGIPHFERYLPVFEPNLSIKAEVEMALKALEEGFEKVGGKELLTYNPYAASLDKIEEKNRKIRLIQMLLENDQNKVDKKPHKFQWEIYKLFNSVAPSPEDWAKYQQEAIRRLSKYKSTLPKDVDTTASRRAQPS